MCMSKLKFCSEVWMLLMVVKNMYEELIVIFLLLSAVSYEVANYLKQTTVPNGTYFLIMPQSNRLSVPLAVWCLIYHKQ